MSLRIGDRCHWFAVTFFALVLWTHMGAWLAMPLAKIMTTGAGLSSRVNVQAEG